MQIFDVLGIEVGQSSLIVNDSQAGMPNLLRIDDQFQMSNTSKVLDILRDEVGKFVKNME